MKKEWRGIWDEERRGRFKEELGKIEGEVQKRGVQGEIRKIIEKVGGILKEWGKEGIEGVGEREISGTRNVRERRRS